MRLSLLPLASSPHKDSVIALGWSSSNELYSCSEDHTIWRWNRNAEALSKIYTCTESFTELRWYPWISQRHRGGSGGDVFAVGFRDGAFCIINKGGREERRIEAHKGAVLSLQWNLEGTLLATGGEDGFVKVWSRNGMLRTNVCQNEQVVSALAWAPDSNYMLFSSGKSLVIKHIQSSSKHIQWESHEGLVVQVDWNHANNIIVSIGEEGFYKVWDCFGSLSFMGENINARLTSVAWCPSGELFVIGAHNLIVLCDKSGRILSKEKPEVGTLKTLAWSMDGSQLAMGSSNGTVLVGHLIGWRVECLRQIGTSVGSNHVQIQDYLDEKVEELEFRDFIINMCLGFGHLIVTTTSQCLIYSIGDWRAPRIIDIKGIAMILLQSALCFCVGDFSNGLQLFTYEGRKLSNPSVLGLRVEFLNKQNVSLSNDMLAMVDCSDPKTLIFLDTTTGKVFGNGVHHAVRIVEIGLNQQGARADRILTFIDSKYDLKHALPN